MDSEHPSLRRDVMVTPQVRLVRPIGHGGMGSVWVARHLGLNTHVAVKFISAQLDANEPEALARFHREATTAAQISSPHVVRTFDAGVSDAGVPYIVMEFLEGETLSARINRVGSLRPQLVVRVIAHVAKALGSAHRLGIVHRDIKPDNIFLVPTDDGLLCKVLDFGIAKQTRTPEVSSLTTEGALLGTPEYMSPEQIAHGTDVDYRADLWALAVVAYVSLTGRLPFTGTTMGQMCLNLMAARFKPVSEVRRGLPSAADAWFARAFHLDAEQRFEGARDMALALVHAIPDSVTTVKDELLAPPNDSASVSMPPIAAETKLSLARVKRDRSAAEKVDGAKLAPVAGDGFDSRPLRITLSRAAIGLALAGGLGAVVWMSTNRASADPREHLQSRRDGAALSRAATASPVGAGSSSSAFWAPALPPQVDSYRPVERVPSSSSSPSSARPAAVKPYGATAKVRPRPGATFVVPDEPDF